MEADRKEIKKLAGQLNYSLTRKCNNLKDDIIAALGKLEEKGYEHFKKTISVPMRMSNGKIQNIRFKGLKRIDMHLYFEDKRKTLYECSVATVDGLMTVLEMINEELTLDNNIKIL